MANLVVIDSRDQEAGKKAGPVSIAFESVRGESGSSHDHIPTDFEGGC